MAEEGYIDLDQKEKAKPEVNLNTKVGVLNFNAYLKPGEP